MPMPGAAAQLWAGIRTTRRGAAGSWGARLLLTAVLLLSGAGARIVVPCQRSCRRATPLLPSFSHDRPSPDPKPCNLGGVCEGGIPRWKTVVRGGAGCWRLRGGAPSPAPLIPVEVYRYRFIACFVNDFCNLYRNVRAHFEPVLRVAIRGARAVAAEAIRQRRRGARASGGTVQSRMDGMVCLVTGANRGIGREIAKQMLLKGARVLLACRSLERGRRTALDLQKETGSNRVSVHALDLSSIKSVAGFAASLNEEEVRLDVLVNNAAAFPLTYTKTSDKVEEAFQVSHLSPLALTLLLMPCLTRVDTSVNETTHDASEGRASAGSMPARVINLVSKCENMAQDHDLDAAFLDVEDKVPDAAYDALGGYAAANLATTMSTFALARMLGQVRRRRERVVGMDGTGGAGAVPGAGQEDGHGHPLGKRKVVVCACSPGRARTGLFGAPSLGGKVLTAAARVCAWSAQKAARGPVWLASSHQALELFQSPHPFVSGTSDTLHTPGPASADLEACQRVLHRSMTLADCLLASDIGYQADLFKIAQDLSSVGVLGKQQIDVLLREAQQNDQMLVTAANVFLFVYARYDLSPGARRRCRELVTIFRDPGRFGLVMDRPLPQSIATTLGESADDFEYDSSESSSSTSSSSTPSLEMYAAALSGNVNSKSPQTATSPRQATISGASSRKATTQGSAERQLKEKRDFAPLGSTSPGAKSPLVRGRGTPPRKQPQPGQAPSPTHLGVGGEQVPAANSALAGILSGTGSLKDAWEIMASKIKGQGAEEWVPASSIAHSEEREAMAPEKKSERSPTKARSDVKMSRRDLERMCLERGLQTEGLKKAELERRLKAFSAPRARGAYQVQDQMGFS